MSRDNPERAKGDIMKEQLKCACPKCGSLENNGKTFEVSLKKGFCSKCGFTLEPVFSQPWCMCETVTYVARDGFATCSQCGGKDAYKSSSNRPLENKMTKIGDNKWVKSSQ